MALAGDSLLMRSENCLHVSDCEPCVFTPNQIPLPANPLWYPLFDVKGEDIREICLAILRLYARKKVRVLNLLL